MDENNQKEENLESLEANQESGGNKSYLSIIISLLILVIVFGVIIWFMFNTSPGITETENGVEEESQEIGGIRNLREGVSPVVSIYDLEVGDQFGPFVVEEINIEDLGYPHVEDPQYTLSFTGQARVNTEIEYFVGMLGGFHIELQSPDLPIIEERFIPGGEETSPHEYYHRFLIVDRNQLLDLDASDGDRFQAELILANPHFIKQPIGAMPTITLVEVVSVN